MADTNFRGPVNSMGALEVDGATAAVQPLDGPSSSYQGYSFPDIRSAPFAKDGFRPGQQPGTITNGNVFAVDAVPQAAATGVLAGSQVMTALTAFSLATVGLAGFSAGAASIAVGVPIIPLGQSTVTTVIALDFGFTTGTTVAGNTAIVVPDNTLFKTGQWIIVGNVGNTAATQSLITQVQSISTTTSTGITVSPAPATALSNVPIGQANLFGGAFLPPATQFGPAAASANAHAPYLEAGLMRVANPREMLSRVIALSGTGGTTTVTASVLVTGYDVWGARMTELITANAGGTTAWGKKAFKYVLSAVGQTSVATAYVLGIGDVFGMPYRADEWEQTEISWASAWGTANTTGFIAAATTSLNTSGDVRGTVQVSVNTAAGTTNFAGGATNNVRRLAIVQNLGVWNQVYGTPTNTAPMFGVAQSTA